MPEMNRRGCWLSSESVEDEACPEEDGVVRATLRASGYLIRPDGDGGCEVTYVTQTNFNGRIPPSFMNLVYRQQPLTLAKLRKVLTGEDYGLLDGGLLDVFM